MNDEMPDPFAVAIGRYSTDEDAALTSTVDALDALRKLATLVGYGFDEGMRQVDGTRDTGLPCGPFAFEDLVMEVTGHAYAMCDDVRKAFGVPLPTYGPKTNPQMPEGGWPDPWGDDSPTAA